MQGSGVRIISVARSGTRTALHILLRSSEVTNSKTSRLSSVLLLHPLVVPTSFYIHPVTVQDLDT